MTSHPGVLYFHEVEFIARQGGVVEMLRGKITPDDFINNMLLKYYDIIVDRIWGYREAAPAVYTPEVFKSILLDSFTAERTLVEAASLMTDKLFNLGANAFERPYWIEKTPQSVEVVDVLFRMFPDLRFIHMIRDPRDTACSYLKKKFGPNSVDEFIPFYKEIMGKAWRAMQDVPEEQYLVIQLEKLIISPIDTLVKVFDFACFPYTNEQIVEMAETIDIKKANVGRWRKDITTDQAQAIEYFCGDTFRLWKMVAKWSQSLVKQRSIPFKLEHC
jgi:hypothetical protein